MSPSLIILSEKNCVCSVSARAASSFNNLCLVMPKAGKKIPVKVLVAKGPDEGIVEMAELAIKTLQKMKAQVDTRSL